MGFPGLGPEAAEHDAPEGGVLFEPGRHRPHRDAGRPGNRKPVDPGRDGGEREGREPVRGGEPKRLAVAALEEGVLAVAATAPHRADGVDDVAGGEGVAPGDAGFPGRAAAEAAAFLEERGPVPRGG